MNKHLLTQKMFSFVKDEVFKITMVLPTNDTRACSILLKRIAAHVKKGAQRMEDGVMSSLKEVTKTYLKEEKNQKIQNFRCSWLKCKCCR